MPEKKESPQARYNRTRCKLYSFRFVLSTEADLIARLEAQPNKAGYVKSLIRADIEKDKGEKK